MPDEDQYTLREMRIGNRREAELLADMWNRSDAGWPGGWTGGVPITADRVLSEEMQWDCYGQWVVERSGEIVGLVSMMADPSQPQRGYVGMLNARPDHHGRGVGKRLVRRCVDCATEAGLAELDLYTWAGNLKAVPLYKKMGFFWAPETNVEMQNFIPAIVRVPLLTDFFKRHDWYEVQERDLAVAEDVDHWRGVRVYRYRFAAEGQTVEVIADRLARMLTAVETNEVSVAAWVGKEDLSALQEHTLRYELRNKTDRPLQVSVMAQGEPGVPVSFEESFELKGRRRLTVPFRLPADLERKKPGEPAHRVLTTVTVDSVPIKLGTAVRMRDPVEIESADWAFAAGKWTEIHIKLRNRLPFPVSGSLWLGIPAELERSKEELTFRIARWGWTRVSLRLRAGCPGAFPVEARVNFSRETAQRLAKGKTPAPAPRGRVRILWVRAFAPGTFAVSNDAETHRLTVESDRMRVAFHRSGGYLAVWHREVGRGLMQVWMPEAGPPFGQFSPVPPVYDVEVRERAGAVDLTIRRPMERRPGLTLERTVVVTAGMLEVRHRLVNATDRRAEVQVKAGLHGSLGGQKITVPGAQGLIQHDRRNGDQWPGWREIAGRSSEFSETWIAAEEDGAVAGVVWDGDAEVSPSGGGGAEFTFGPVAVPAGGASELPTTWAVVGPGDYKTVRSAWEAYVRAEPLLTPVERNPEIQKLLRGGLSDVPLLLKRSPQRTAVELATEQRRKLTAEAHLTLPKVVALSDGKRERRFRVRQLAKGGPFRCAISLKATARGPTAGVGELRLAAQRHDHVFPVPVVIVRNDRPKLKLERADDMLTVDTGVMQFKVSAEHGGAIVSLRHRRRELLWTSYPKPVPYRWFNPWYGGLRALMGSVWDRRLLNVKRAIEPVSIAGNTGLRWRGAKVTCTPTHEDFRWLLHEVLYLASAGSNLLAIITTARNRTPAPMWESLGVEMWPGEHISCAHIERDGKPCAYKPDEHGYSMQPENWLAFADASGAALAIIAPSGNQRRALAFENLGDGHLHGTVWRSADLNPKARTQTELTWVVPCRSVEEAHAYRFLKELDELP